MRQNPRLSSSSLPDMEAQPPPSHEPDREHSNNPSLQHTLFSPPPLPLDRPGAPSSSTLTPLPPLPESPLTTTTPTVDGGGAVASLRPAPVLRTASSSTSNTPNLSPPPTIRTVTPDPFDQRRGVAQDTTATSEFTTAAGTAAAAAAAAARPFGPASTQSSPRAIPGASTLSPHGNSSSRRQGIVFSDAVAGSFDSTSSSPPPRPSSYRPRTHTMDGATTYREHIASAMASEPRHRVGSFSSTGNGDTLRAPLPLLQGPSLESLSHAPSRPPDIQVASTIATSTITPSSSAASVASNAAASAATSWSGGATIREKKGPSRRLIKRASSRPTSPLISPLPSIDSLPLPIPTDDANKVLMLMKTLCGRMRGEFEYQRGAEGPWARGMGFIEEEKGSLMFDAGEQGPFQATIIPDLRGARVLPVVLPDRDGPCLELVNAQGTIDIVLQPLVDAEFDLWLAALISWQQLRPPPGVVTAALPKPSNTTRSVSAAAAAATTDSKRRGSTTKVSPGAIIKVGKVMLWDKGVATSPRAIVKRPSTKDLKTVQASWRRVSCIMQGNGEFKLMTENDVTILSVIELTQLDRCAIQQLDKSVLDEEYCIAIFPSYAPTSTQLSIFRPVYIALDSRVAFEVWFVLLRAFAVPDIHAIDTVSKRIYDMATSRPVSEPVEQPPLPEDRELFRLEKSLTLRVTEAKIKPRLGADNNNGGGGGGSGGSGGGGNGGGGSGGGGSGSGNDRKERSERHERHDRHDRSGKNDTPDPLVGNYLAEVILDGEVRARTTTKTDTKNPFWREDCEFVDLPSTLPFLSVILKRVEGNLDSFTHQLQASLGLPKTGNLREIMLGAVDIPLNTMERGKDHEQWLPVYDDHQQAVGSMLIKVHHEELVVLAADQYKPICDLLQNFSSGLTLQIAGVMSGSLRRLAEVFLNIFQVTDTTSDWIMALVEDEIDGIGSQATLKKMRFSRRLRSNESIESASDREQIVRDMGRSLQGEANLLFRGNSLLTQALEFHMRRLGKEYLEDVLSDKIFEINEINPDCEVDPSKVQAGDDINKHWDQLMLLTKEVWECIAASAQRFPAELRHILKYVRAVADDRYGDFLRTVAYTSVSGFLFLRFVCPAILNPKLFGLLRDHPRPRAQRTLTLVAKGLQALANLSTIGKKETWMEPMNRFLTAHRQSVKDFLDTICSIPADKPNTPVVVPPSYSTPVTIMSRLSVAAREGFPSLPYLIDHPRNLAALVKLWMDANPRTSSESQIYQGELLEFHTLCAELQAKSDECLVRAETTRHYTETGSLTTEDALADAMERASLADSISLSYANNPTWTESAEALHNYSTGRSGGGGTLIPPGSSGSEVEDQRGRCRKDRQMSSGSYNNGPHGMDFGGSIKGFRNGKQARKFLSGIMSRKPRASSPEPAGSSASSPVVTFKGRDPNDHDEVREREQTKSDRDQARKRDRKRTNSKDKPGHGHGHGFGGGVGSWGTSSMTSADLTLKSNNYTP